MIQLKVVTSDVPLDPNDIIDVVTSGGVLLRQPQGKPLRLSLPSHRGR